MVEASESVMKWRCPRPNKARQIGCLDIQEDALCTRKEWSGGITYFKENKRDTLAKAEVICERIKATLHKG